MSQLCKCDRCGDILPLFQYTRFETMVVENVVDNGEHSNPRFTTKTEDIGEKRGLCRDCAIEVNKRNYDAKMEIGEPLPAKEKEV